MSSQNLTQLGDILGGIDIQAGSNTNIITTIGGFDKHSIPHETNVVVGDTVKTFVKNKISEWQTFKDVYFKDGKLDTKYYDKFITMLNNIYPLPVNSNNDEELIYMIYNIYISPLQNICNGINKLLNLKDPFKKTIKHLFMLYKMFIEKLMHVFVVLRNRYIDKNKLDDKHNNFNELLNRWSEIDLENKIDTSSIILFFNFPPKAVELDKSIPKIKWHISNTKELNDLIDKFLKQISDNNFSYVGFCSHVIVKRFKLLLDFPVDELISIINKLLPNNMSDDLNKNDKIVISKISDIIKIIKSVNNPINIKLKKVNVKDFQHFPKTHDEKVKFYIKYINAYLDLYQKTMPYFIKKEKNICNASMNMNILANDIQTITNIFDKIIK